MSDCRFTTRPDPSSLLPSGMAPMVVYCMTHGKYGGCDQGSTISSAFTEYRTPYPPPNADSTFSLVVSNSLGGRTYEASESTRDRSVREMKLGPHRIRHRFPIRGGIDAGEVVKLNLTAPNPLFEALKKKR